MTDSLQRAVTRTGTVASFRPYVRALYGTPPPILTRESYCGDDPLFGFVLHNPSLAVQPAFPWDRVKEYPAASR